MAPPEPAQPERHDTDSLDHLVAERAKRDLHASGRELSITSRLLQAIRGALYREPLQPEETAAHEAARGDSLAGLISMRVETALSTALDEASKESGGGAETAVPLVVVLRRSGGDTASKVDSQVASALSEVKARIGSGPHGIERTASSRLLLLAHSAAFEKLRRRLPALLADDQKRIAFISRRKRDEAPAPRAASDIEIVQADAELEPLEQHLATLLAKKRAPPARAADESMGFASGGTESREARAAEAAPDALMGTLFHNKYRIVRKIGHGGFGSVYEARDERGAGNRVAIKVLRTDLAGNRALFQSFKNEARRVTRLSHPNIVDWKVFDETEDGTQYLVMELVEGEELDRVLSREGTLPPARVASILLQILDALRAAHNLAEGGSILHLDLKPRNVFLVQGKRDKADLVKVIDFGIGQYIGGEEEEELPDLDGDTPAQAESGETSFNPTTMSFHRKQEAEPASPDTKGTRFKRSRACTPEYASPEQCVHVLGMPEMIELDGRSDIYSLGVMGFQMLTGHLPFQRPLMRSDMLRLHMQKAPRKVGAMGVRVPRALAKFIDRCLEKDRDKRFASTNEAWRELHRIVHPPVSHTVAKIVVPLVIIALVAIGSLWAKVGARAAPIGLSVADLGLDLSREALYLGPSRPSATVTASTSEGRAALSGGATVRLLAAEGGSALEGWTATFDGSGGIAIAPSTPPASSLDQRVVIDVEDAEVEFQSFRLLWLAQDAWTVRSIQVGSARLYDGASEKTSDARAIDPSGQSIDLRIGGPVIEPLQSVSLRVGGSEPLVLRVAQKTAQDDLYRASLGDLGLVRGANEVSVVVTDRAGRTWKHALPIEVIADRLVLSDTKLLDQSGAMSECNQALGRYTIYPTTRPLMRLSFDRTVDVQWRIVMDGAGEVQSRQKSAGKRVHEIPLETSAPFNGKTEGAGTIFVEADDSAYVAHAEGDDRGRTEERIMFDRSAVAAKIAVLYEDAGLRRRLAEGNEMSVDRHDVTLLVTRESTARVKVSASAALVGSDETTIPVEVALKVDNEAQIPLRLPRDGRYTVTVSAFQYLSQADVVGDRPDVEQKYTFVVDTVGPKLDVQGLKPQQLVLPKDGRAARLDVSVGAGASSGSPVDVSWSIVAAGQTQPSKIGEVGHGLAEPQKIGFDLPDLWSGESVLTDGDYTLVVQARDVAGNASEPIRVPFSVAARGPRVDLDTPQDGVTWRRTPTGDWELELRASDPNGVERVACELLRVGVAGAVLPVPLSTASTDPSDEQFWTGRVSFPEGWSKADVQLRFSAVDRAGMASTVEKGPFRLPEIEAARPALVAVVVPDRGAERMRLVPGNRGFTYYFGGQGDEMENRLFVQAGLDRFNERLSRTGDQISWQIAYAAGEIEDFYLDEHEVTCGQFLEFVNDKANGYSDRSHWPAGSAPGDAKRIAELASRLSSAARDLPVTDVTWDEASAYAHWIGKRLPSWVEWEYAARGGQAYRPFAACASASSKTAQINVARAGSTGEPWLRGVGADVTPDTGISNMTGNVAEWTASPDLTNDEVGVDLGRHARANAGALLRPTGTSATHYWTVGGSFARSALNFFTYDSRERSSSRSSLGFRCAASLADVQASLAEARFAVAEAVGPIPK